VVETISIPRKAMAEPSHERPVLSEVSSKSKPRLCEAELPSDFKPGKFSVIIGHGKACKNAIGNRGLKELVAKFMQQYSQADNKREKSDIMTTIMRIIQTACRRKGAFVKFAEGSWWEVREQTAREKIGYILRDLLADKYRSSSKSKTAIRRSKQTQEDETSNMEHETSSSWPSSQEEVSPAPTSSPGAAAGLQWSLQEKTCFPAAGLHHQVNFASNLIRWHGGGEQEVRVNPLTISVQQPNPFSSSLPARLKEKFDDFTSAPIPFPSINSTYGGSGMTMQERTAVQAATNAAAITSSLARDHFPEKNAAEQEAALLRRDRAASSALPILLSAQPTVLYRLHINNGSDEEHQQLPLHHHAAAAADDVESKDQTAHYAGTTKINTMLVHTLDEEALSPPEEETAVVDPLDRIFRNVGAGNNDGDDLWPSDLEISSDIFD
jgi:hypothetical protein